LLPPPSAQAAEAQKQASSNRAYWIRREAEAGGAEGQCELGYLTENGLGVEKDNVEAYKWYFLAGGKNNVEATQGMERLKQLMTAEDIAEAQKRAASLQGTAPTTAEEAAPPSPSPTVSYKKKIRKH